MPNTIISKLRLIKDLLPAPEAMIIDIAIAQLRGHFHENLNLLSDVKATEFEREFLRVQHAEMKAEVARLNQLLSRGATC